MFDVLIVCCVDSLQRIEMLNCILFNNTNVHTHTHAGYNPLVTSEQGAMRIANYYSTAGRLTNADYFEIAHLGWWISIIMGTLFVCV